MDHQSSGPPIQRTTHPVGHWPLALQSSHGIRLCRAGPSFHRSQSPVTSYRSARARKPNTDLVILQRTSTYNVVRSIRQSGAGCVPTGRCICARSFDLRLRVVGIRLWATGETTNCWLVNRRGAASRDPFDIWENKYLWDGVRIYS